MSAYSDPALKFMLRVGLAVLGITLLLLLHTLLLRARLMRRQRRERQFVEKWQPLLMQGMTTVPKFLPRVPKSEWHIFLSLWIHFQETVREESRLKLNQLAWTCGMDHAARQLLDHRSVRTRLMAVTTLGHLQDKNAWARLKSIVNDRHPLLSLAAARALTQIDAKAALPELLPLFTRRHDWPLNKIANILNEAGPDVASAPLTQIVQSAAPEQFPRLVRLLDCAHGEQALPALRRIMFATTDDGVISACLQELRDPHDAGFARAQMGHRSWFVRVQAVSALGRLGTRDDCDLLIAPLSDPIWWVRYRAAQALASLPAITLAEVQQIRENSSDRFARDILAQVIAEKQPA
ncbi:MAG TPA: HEAT repeat domain-containing protein [Burkholderiales bacterium]|nr:HEAT repeat domain-containing protein [Burkholderiales bacterium]